MYAAAEEGGQGIMLVQFLLADAAGGTTTHRECLQDRSLIHGSSMEWIGRDAAASGGGPGCYVWVNMYLPHLRFPPVIHGHCNQWMGCCGAGPVDNNKFYQPSE